MKKSNFTLLIDADDTLWENNRYFEDVINKLVSILINNFTLKEEKIKELIWKHERINAKKYGYGSNSFAISLKAVVDELVKQSNGFNKEIHKLIDIESKFVYNHPINFFNGVKKHLELLYTKYNLILVTKGNEKEQLNKIEKAEIKHLFQNIEILPEKNEKAYKDIVKKYNLNKKFTYMIGNSPKSDINPAKRIGLNTILIPYYLTWELDQAEIIKGEPKTVILDSFTQIDEYISSLNISII